MRKYPPWPYIDLFLARYMQVGASFAATGYPIATKEPPPQFVSGRKQIVKGYAPGRYLYSVSTTGFHVNKERGKNVIFV